MSDPLDRLGDVVRAVAPHVDACVWAAAMRPWLTSSGIVTPHRIAAFVGQTAEESGGFTVMQENLNYSADGLRATWPGRFAPTPGMPAAEAYAHQPEKIADYVYANRLGNGDVASGDGWRFRGEGAMEDTGRAAYMQFATAMNMTPVQAAAWMLEPTGAMASACWYWSLPYHKPPLNILADAWQLTALTKAINGDLINLNRRIADCSTALTVFGAVAPPSLNSTPAAPPTAVSESDADRLNDEVLDGKFPTATTESST